jgi:hypothetical protein
VAAVAILILASCGSTELSLTEYAEQANHLIQSVDGRLDTAAADLYAQPASIERTQEYLALRVAGYEELVAGFGALNPPERISDLHQHMMGILTDQLAAERERLDLAATMGSIDEIDRIWESPASEAIRAIEQEAIALCVAAQDVMDATQMGETFEGTAWMSRDVAEVVTTAFGCPSE